MHDNECAHGATRQSMAEQYLAVGVPSRSREPPRWKLPSSCGLSTRFTPESAERKLSWSEVFGGRAVQAWLGALTGRPPYPYSGDQGRDLVELVAVHLKLDVQVVTTLQVHPEPVRRSQRP